MEDKKYPGKFTVRFNIADPQQRMAAELLNQQGRRKAQFLTNAVLFYVQAVSDGQLPTLSEAMYQRTIQPVSISAEPPAPQQKTEDDDMESIRRTMEAFQFSQNNGA